MKTCLDAVTPELLLNIEQWYYQEARLLNNRQYQTWLSLCAEDISYTMPSRTNPLVNNREQGNEYMIATERELEGTESDGNPLRDENIVHLFLRVDRSFKMNAWAENPPARTRRIIGNVEITAIEDEEVSVTSAFHLFYARPGMQDFIYAGQRNDVLQETADGYKIARREIIMDLADINVPTLGLFL